MAIIRLTEQGFAHELQVVKALLSHLTCSWGYSINTIESSTSLSHSEVWFALGRLMECGLVESSIRQVGTGGSTDRFYRLAYPDLRLTGIEFEKP